MYKIEKNRLLFHQYYLEVPFSVQAAMQKLQDVTLPDAKKLLDEASWWSSVGKNSRN